MYIHDSIQYQITMINHDHDNDNKDDNDGNTNQDTNNNNLQESDFQNIS